MLSRIREPPFIDKKITNNGQSTPPGHFFQRLIRRGPTARGLGQGRFPYVSREGVGDVMNSGKENRYKE